MSIILDAGIGIVDVAILDPHGRKDAVRPTVIKRSEELWYVEYTPKEEGLHSVNVFFAGKAIPKSPFGVGVAPGGWSPTNVCVCACMCWRKREVERESGVSMTNWPIEVFHEIFGILH